jgi:hypothetical protein
VRHVHLWWCAMVQMASADVHQSLSCHELAGQMHFAVTLPKSVWQSSRVHSKAATRCTPRTRTSAYTPGRVPARRQHKTLISSRSLRTTHQTACHYPTGRGHQRTLPTVRQHARGARLLRGQCHRRQRQRRRQHAAPAQEEPAQVGLCGAAVGPGAGGQLPRVRCFLLSAAIAGVVGAAAELKCPIGMCSGEGHPVCSQAGACLTKRRAHTFILCAVSQVTVLCESRLGCRVRTSEC